MIKYVIPSSEKELLDARRAGCIIELNGTAINGGYGETWNPVENFDKDDLYDYRYYRILYTVQEWRKPHDHMDIANSDLLGYPIQFNDFDYNNYDSPNWVDWDKSPMHEPYMYRIGYEKSPPKTQTLEVTLKFEVDADFDYENIPALLRKEFPNYDYKTHFVYAQILTENNLGSLKNLERLEFLEQSASLITQLLTDDKSKFSCDLSNELSYHNSYFRNKKGKK